MKFINLTPHAINLNDGTILWPSEIICRIASTHTEFDLDGVCSIAYGEVENLPDAEDGVMYVVSALVAQVVRRTDVVSPATGHPLTVRKNGLIVSVPGYVRG